MSEAQTMEESFAFEQMRRSVAEYYMTDASDQADESCKERFLGLIDALRIDIAIDLNTDELLQRKNLDYELAQAYIDDMRRNGSWSDVEYEDQDRSGWQAKLHLERLHFLTKVYLQESSPFYKNKKLSKKLHKGLGYWFNNSFESPNWWYQEIGVPKILGPIAVMLYDELSEKERQSAVRVLSQAEFGRTGQNKVWLAGNVLFKAMILEDVALATEARNQIFEELAMATGEGIQLDYSFHQHGPQQQFGNYGLAFISSMTYWGRVLGGAEFKMNADQVGLLRNLLLEGYQWIIWRNHFDISSMGRQIFMDDQRASPLCVTAALVDMLVIDANNEAAYLPFIKSVLYPNSENELIGNHHFWRSDYTIHRAGDWFASIKLSSERVIGSEAGNSENLKGYYLADGATYVMNRGDEYYNIFPVWDWRRLPGVTCPQGEHPLPVLSWDGYRNGSDFSGGVTSDQLGITSTHLERDGLSAKKSWFFLGDEIVCLGAGITNIGDVEIATSINQCLLNGEVAYSDGEPQTLDSSATLNSSALKWVYHDEVLYRIFGDGEFMLSNETQEGDWHDIANKYASNPESADVFSLTWSHVNAPENASYAYSISLNSSLEEANNELEFEIVRNDESVQAIASTDGSVRMYAVHSPTELSFDGRENVVFETPGLYLFEGIEGTWNLRYVDPTQKVETATLELGGDSISLELPTGKQSGTAVQHRF